MNKFAPDDNYISKICNDVNYITRYYLLPSFIDRSSFAYLQLRLNEYQEIGKISLRYYSCKRKWQGFRVNNSTIESTDFLEVLTYILKKEDE